jgi:hypothetical protein
MIRIKSGTDAPDFKSPSGTPTEAYCGICIRWRNAEGGLKDKQMGDFIQLYKSSEHNHPSCSSVRFVVKNYVSNGHIVSAKK